MQEKNVAATALGRHKVKPQGAPEWPVAEGARNPRYRNLESVRSMEGFVWKPRRPDVPLHSSIFFRVNFM